MTNEEIFITLLMCVVVVLFVCWLVSMAISSQARYETCENLSINMEANSFKVTVDSVCILEFCETVVVGNKTFIHNCEEEEWRLNP